MSLVCKFVILTAATLLLCAHLDLARSAPPARRDSSSASDARLRGRLYSEYPELKPDSPSGRQLDDWERIVRLRDFSYRHTGYANNVDSKAYRIGTANVNDAVLGRKSLDEAYSFFDEGRGGVVCGGTASLFHELCKWAGYDAWILNVGFDVAGSSGVTFTHVVVLVRTSITSANGENVEAITIHDPSVNLSYTHADEETPLDYFEMLAKLRRGRASEIGLSSVVDPGTRRAEPVTVAYADETKHLTPQDLSSSWNIGEPFTWSIGPQGQWIFHAPRMLNDFELLGDVIWKPEMKRRGLPPETLYLHLRPIGITGPNGERLLQRAREIVATKG